MLVSGTVVTGAGPHGGDDRADRINVTLQSVARVHSILVLTLIALALVIAWRIRDQDGPLRTRLTWALGAMVAQGAVGYTQYFTGVPAAVVGVHVLGSLIVWVTVLRLHLLMAPVGDETAPRPDSTVGSGVVSLHLRWVQRLQILRARMGPMTAPMTTPLRPPEADDVAIPERPWVVIVWNDPVNLMQYVTFVFQKLFGYPKAKAEKLMMEVHEEGRSVVASGDPREV